LAVTIERAIHFRHDYALDQDLRQKILLLLEKGEFTQLNSDLANNRNPLAQVVQAGVKDIGASVEEAEISMRNEAEVWMPLIEKRLEILDTIITAAPLMGLLGTITGMMSSFQILSEKGVNQPNAITGGVAEALIATATGLVIALLALIAYNYFNSKVKSLAYEMETISSFVTEAKMRSLRMKK